MSAENVRKVIARAVSDGSFRERLFHSPDEAFSGYDLTEQERSSILAGLSREGFDTLSSDLGDRVSRAGVHLDDFVGGLVDAVGSISGEPINPELVEAPLSPPPGPAANTGGEGEGPDSASLPLFAPRPATNPAGAGNEPAGDEVAISPPYVPMPATNPAEANVNVEGAEIESLGGNEPAGDEVAISPPYVPMPATNPAEANVNVEGAEIESLGGNEPAGADSVGKGTFVWCASANPNEADVNVEGLEDEGGL